MASGLIDEAKPKDPRDPNCAPGIHRLYTELCNACTHWSWDGDDKDRLYPQYPYDAMTSSTIEWAYRAGMPSCWVCP